MQPMEVSYTARQRINGYLSKFLEQHYELMLPLFSFGSLEELFIGGVVA